MSDLETAQEGENGCLGALLVALAMLSPVVFAVGVALFWNWLA